MNCMNFQVMFPPSYGNYKAKITEEYCPFYWDGITCWNATPPFKSIYSPCASWPISEPPPEGEVVERKCLSGYWENMTTRSLEMLYNNCNPYINEEPAIVYSNIVRMTILNALILISKTFSTRLF